MTRWKYVFGPGPYEGVFAGETHEEIADKSGCPLRTVQHLAQSERKRVRADETNIQAIYKKGELLRSRFFYGNHPLGRHIRVRTAKQWRDYTSAKSLAKAFNVSVSTAKSWIHGTAPRRKHGITAIQVDGRDIDMSRLLWFVQYESGYTEYFETAQEAAESYGDTVPALYAVGRAHAKGVAVAGRVRAVVTADQVKSGGRFSPLIGNVSPTEIEKYTPEQITKAAQLDNAPTQEEVDSRDS